MAGKIICGDCIQFLIDSDAIKTSFADIPDNINYSYKDDKDNIVYKDNLDLDNYQGWITSLVSWAMIQSEIFWLSYNQKHDLFIKSLLNDILYHNFPEFTYKQILWRYTFGQYNSKDFSSGYRPIIRLMRKGTKVNTNAIKVDSARMKLGDKRAAGPRLPDDVWDFPRIVGNAKERRKHFPTQHPEALMERIIKYSCGPKDTFVDLCAGSFTSGIVAERLGMDWICVEQSKYYCDKGSEILGIPVEIQ